MRARKRSGYIALTYAGYAPITLGVYEGVPEQAALSAMEHGYQLVFVPGQGGRRTWSTRRLESRRPVRDAQTEYSCPILTRRRATSFVR